MLDGTTSAKIGKSQHCWSASPNKPNTINMPTNIGNANINCSSRRVDDFPDNVFSRTGKSTYKITVNIIWMTNAPMAMANRPYLGRLICITSPNHPKNKEEQQLHSNNIETNSEAIKFYI